MKTKFTVKKTSPCPCGHKHRIGPNAVRPTTTLWCGQCNCFYDRENDAWRDPSSGEIVEPNSRPLKQKRGIEYDEDQE